MLQDYTFGCMQNTKNTTNKTLENKELNITINCDEITGENTQGQNSHQPQIHEHP